VTYRRYAAERIAASLAVLFLAASLAYVVVHVFGPGGAKPIFQPGGLDVVRRVNYVHYSHETYPGFLWRLVGHGSLGHTLGGIDLTRETFGSAPVTLSLAGGVLVFALLTGVPLGLLWARRKRVGSVAEPLVDLGLAAWPLWLGLVFSLYLGSRLSAFPIAGYCNFFGGPHGSGCSSGPVDWSYHLVLPSIALGLALAAVYAGVTRRLAVAVASSQETDARRQALVAFAKLIVRNASWLIGATFFIEVIFNLPGLDSLLLAGFNGGDPPTLEATLIAVSVLAVVLSLAVDLVAGAFLPDWRVNEFQPGFQSHGRGQEVLSN